MECRSERPSLTYFHPQTRTQVRPPKERDDPGWKQAGKHWAKFALKLKIPVLSAYVSSPSTESTLARAWFFYICISYKIFHKVIFICRSHLSRNELQRELFKGLKWSSLRWTKPVPSREQQSRFSGRSATAHQPEATRDLWGESSKHPSRDVSFLVQREIWQREQAMIVLSNLLARLLSSIWFYSLSWSKVRKQWKSL